MNCDICGKRENLVSVLVENVKMDVCSNCVRYGKVIQEAEKPKIIVKKYGSVEVIVDGYSSKIKNKRELIGLTQKDLAMKLNEKESIIHSIESGRMEPELSLAKKLETFLKINLIETVDESPGKQTKVNNAGLTIGDMLKFKK